MKKSIFLLPLVLVIFSLTGNLTAQKVITVRFRESDEVLTNPGMGFTTFQRFNGDKTNEGVGWTEGMPVDYHDSVFIPRDMPAGVYQIQAGIVDIQSHEPKVNLAISGRDPEGWYPIGKIEIR